MIYSDVSTGTTVGVNDVSVNFTYIW